jgi:TRAP transporter TAXI family solute receptor
MNTFRARLISLRDLLATVWPLVLITVIGFVFAYQFVQPAPSRQISISAGTETGAYYAYARRYAAHLVAKGVTLEVRSSAGAHENLQRLKNGEVDIAFIQGGVQEELASGEESQLRSMGSVAYEPVWVFYRHDSRVDELHLLKGKRIAVGKEGSGSYSLVTRLLEANGIKKHSSGLVQVAGPAAADALQRGEVDAVMIVSTVDAPAVQKMLHLPDVRLMSFSQADAYTRRFPFLSKVVLPRGVLDLVHDLPPKDTALISTTANVVVHEDLHPALASLLLQAMSEVNGKSGFFQRPGEFPSYKDQSFALADEAERYFKSGPPFLQHYLPFWMAVLVERLFVLIVPFLVLLVPLLRLAPVIYTWRVRSKLFRCYGDLKFLENDLRKHYDASRHADYLARLDRIEEDAYARNIPLAFSDLLYTLREHINLVRDKLDHLEFGHTPDKKS